MELPRGESEHKIPLMTAQYIMYDMPDDEILGFWGKRPFIAKRFPYTKEDEESKAPEVPALRLHEAVSTVTKPVETEKYTSWRTDPTLLRHS